MHGKGQSPTPLFAFPLHDFLVPASWVANGILRTALLALVGKLIDSSLELVPFAFSRIARKKNQELVDPQVSNLAGLYHPEHCQGATHTRSLTLITTRLRFRIG